MTKKIYDIKPPRVAKKTEREIKKFIDEGKKKKPTAVVRHKKERNFPWKIFSGVGVLVLVLLCGFLYFKLQKVTVEIWPNVETLSYTQTVLVDKSAQIVSVEDNTIPAKYVEVESTESQEFPATGNGSNGGEATGTVTIYNKSTSITLKDGTHLLSDSGKYFITLAKIVVPGGTKSKPGSVRVKVKAVEGGENFNIGPANFSIPKLSGTNYYYSIYGVSTEAMSGGYTGDVKKITEDDIINAKDSLVDKVSGKALEDLKSKIGEGYVLLDDAVSYTTTSAESDTKAGTVTDKFNYTVNVKAEALAFKKSDLDEFVKDYVVSQMSEANSILDNSTKVEYTLKTIDRDKGIMKIDVNFSSGVYKTINKNSLSMLLTSKNSSQITDIVNSNLTDSVSRVKVNFWPFWVTKSPKGQKGINIELKF
jgi:hypothetical protein